MLGENSGEYVDNFTIYVASIYWVMTTFTTVGYGDISGNTELEYFYQMIVEIIGIGFFAYLMGNINSLIVQTDSIYELKAAREEELELWLIRLDKAVKQKVLMNDYFQHITKFHSSSWDKSLIRLKREELFQKLKPQMQYELIDYLFKEFFDAFKFFFEGLEHGFKRAVAKNVHFKVYEKFAPFDDKHKDDRTITYMQSNAIIRKGIVPKYVHFILKGTVSLSIIVGSKSFAGLRVQLDRQLPLLRPHATILLRRDTPAFWYSLVVFFCVSCSP